MTERLTTSKEWRSIKIGKGDVLYIGKVDPAIQERMPKSGRTNMKFRAITSLIHSIRELLDSG